MFEEAPHSPASPDQLPLAQTSRLVALLPELQWRLHLFLDAASAVRVRCTCRALRDFPMEGFDRDMFEYFCQVDPEAEFDSAPPEDRWNMEALADAIDDDGEADPQPGAVPRPINSDASLGKILRSPLTPRAMTYLLESARVDPNAHSHWLLRAACVRGWADLVRKILAHPRTRLDGEVVPALLMAEDGVGIDHADLGLPRHPHGVAGAHVHVAWAALGSALEGWTLGHAGCIPTAQLLLDHPSIDPSVNGQAVLHWAVVHGATAILPQLLAHPKLDVAACGHRALNLAVVGGHAAVLDTLLAHPSCPAGAITEPALMLAARRGQGTVVRHLLDSPALAAGELHVPWDALLGHAVDRGDESLVRYLFARHEARLRPGFQDNWALRNACANGHRGIAGLLLAHPAVDPNARAGAALRFAAARGYTEIVVRVLAHPATDPTLAPNPPDAPTALVAAILGDHFETVEVLLEDPRIDPMAVSATPNGRMYPLTAAARLGDALIVDALLAHPHVDPTVNDMEALVVAAQRGHAQAVYRLVTDKRVAPDAAGKVRAAYDASALLQRVIPQYWWHEGDSKSMSMSTTSFGAAGVLSRGSLHSGMHLVVLGRVTSGSSTDSDDGMTRSAGSGI
ncbi:hypothetical protein H9P43_004319 [Blastocladiella emersonii ATCC 22665]|nr:hypothetical protein H9P43_004319 [Blastocladiella emersonii ATCC 22665]